jgi:hypothetical protein
MRDAGLFDQARPEQIFPCEPAPFTEHQQLLSIARGTHIPDRVHMPCFYIERPGKRIFLIKHVCHIRPAAGLAIDGRSPWTPGSSPSAKPCHQARKPRRLRAMTAARPADRAHVKLTVNQGLFGHGPSIIAAS